jgi:fucose permease
MPSPTALTDSSVPKAQGRLSQTAGYYLAFIALGLVTASLGPTLEALGKNVQAPLDQISGLFTAYALGYLVGSLLGGRVYDRAQGHAVMGGVLLVLALLMALMPLVPWLGLLFGVTLLRGAASGTVDVGGNTLLVWLHGREVGPFMNGLHFCFGIGAFASPVIIAQAVQLSGDITWAYWTLAFLIALAALWILHLPSPTARSNREDDPTRGSNPLIVVLVAFVLLLYVGAESSVGGWIYTYATATGLGSESNAAYLTSLFWGVLAAGRLLSILLVTRFSPRTMLIADWLGCLVSVGVMVVLDKASLAVWAGTFGIGLSMASIFPLMLTFAEQRVSITGRVTGWFLVGSSVGGMTLPWLIGQLFESVGPRVTMPAILADLIIATGMFGVLVVYAQVQERG